ncbi:MAG: hypothetical protein LC104_08895 [Bacteroidales bacterium]|nr:hypothetical protein [Bacteroidales bacterium]
MNPPALIAVLLGIGIILLGLVTGILQISGLRQLSKRSFVPSDELTYLRNRHRRRLLTAGVLILIGGLIAGAYLSGMEARADAIAESRRNAVADAPPPPVPVADKQFVRMWGAYWISVIVLVFVLISLAMMDAWSSRRFWMSQYRQLKEEHQTRLRRDLAVYRQQKQTARTGRHGTTD